MSGIGREALPEVQSGREALPDVREVSGDPPGFPGMVKRTYRMSGSDREDFPDVLLALPNFRE